MQQPIKNGNNISQPKSIQQKGLLLAKLLQKKVQDKMNNKGSHTPIKKQGLNNIKITKLNSLIQDKQGITTQSNKNIINNHKQQQQGSENLLQQINQQLTQRKQLKQSTNNKKSINSSLLKSKITSYQQHNFSFDDSLSLQPSFLTFQGQQVSQMLKFIYIQLFGEQKYQSDKKRYQQIQANPYEYNIQQGHQFNKQGKMLQNICYQIKSLKINIKNLTSQVKKLQIKDLQLSKMIQKHKDIFNISNQQNKSKQLPKQKIVQKNYLSEQQLTQQNQILNLTMRQLQQQNYMLQQTIKRLQKQYDDFTTITQNQNLANQRKFKKINQLEDIINLRDKQIDHLLMNIGELQIQLNNIKEQIQAKEKEGIFQPTNRTPKNNNLSDQQNSIQRLSTIKQEQQPVNITDFMQESHRGIQKQVQTEHQTSQRKLSLQSQISTKRLDQNSSQLQRIILELKKVIAHKQKINLVYQKQIQSHQSQVQKYQAFIAELSSQIQICQQKLTQTNKKHGQMINKKLQTDDRYFLLLSNGQKTQNYNNQLTYSERQDGYFVQNPHQKEPSIADEIDYKQRQQYHQFQIKQQITFRKVTDKNITLLQNNKKFIQNNTSTLNSKQNVPSLQQKKQKLWDEISITLSQFSQTQQLKDIRNLTKQLSQAYDKIILLTYQVNNLKKINANKQIFCQQNQINLNQQNIKMIKQK